MISSRLPELLDLQAIIESMNKQIHVETLAEVPVDNIKLPVYGIVLGSKKPEAPTVGFFAGVHGLERIGTRVLVSYLNTMKSLLAWDQSTHELLDRLRIVFMPIVNPSGMYLRTRSNYNGVDLMRNAPIEADCKSRWALVGGHRISPVLPWYRGKAGELEVEVTAVCDFVRRWVLPSKFSLTLDIHSGFGSIDRLWFPYAKSKKPFPDLALAYNFKNLLDQTYPNHVYHVEPQSAQYTTHGDFWDYLYEEHRAKNIGSPNSSHFVPWALELGSWVWVKKNPKQIFTVLGAFNPLMQHRYQRILRRHLALIDFFQKSTAAYYNWATVDTGKQAEYEMLGKKHWFSEITT